MVFCCINHYFTVTLQVAFLELSVVMTDMVAVPLATAVTFPVEDTFATLVFEDVQVTVLMVASEGFMVAVRVVDFPTAKVKDVLFNDTPVTGLFLTVILHFLYLDLSFVLTMTVVDPTFNPLTRPFELTVAMLVSEDSKVTL